MLSLLFYANSPYLYPMIEFKFISIGISFLLGILAVKYIRRYDVYEKEPYLAMLFVTILGEALSIFTAKCIYQILSTVGVSYKSYFTFWGMFAIVGPVEEFAKLFALFLCFPLIKKKMNELNDGIIYMSCIALGFSLIENYQYANSAPGHEHLLFVRLFISTPMHIAFSSFMGLAFYKVIKEKKNFKILLFSFIWASFLHGLFDGVLTLRALYFTVMLVIVMIFNQNLILLRLTNALSPFRKTFKDTITNSQVESNASLICPKCKHKDVHNSYFFSKITLNKCTNCHSFFAQRKSIYRLLKHFAPSFKNFNRRLYTVKVEEKEIYTLKNSFYFEKKKSQYGYFNEEDICNYLDFFKKRSIEKFYTSIISPARYIAVK